MLVQTVVRGGEVQGAGVQQLSAAAGRGPRQPAGLRPLGGAQAAPGGYSCLIPWNIMFRENASMIAFSLF